VIVPSDIEQAALRQWTAGGLLSQAPGDLKTGKRSRTQPGGAGTIQQPYGDLAVKPLGSPQFYTEGGSTPGAPFTAKYTATVTLYGVGNKVMGDLLKATVSAMADQGWLVAGGTVQAVFLIDARLEEDPATKQGEDWWRAILSLEVQVSGTV
jgi:hypothetical protein